MSFNKTSCILKAEENSWMKIERDITAKVKIETVITITIVNIVIFYRECYSILFRAINYINLELFISYCTYQSPENRTSSPLLAISDNALYVHWCIYRLISRLPEKNKNNKGSGLAVTVDNLYLETVQRM